MPVSFDPELSRCTLFSALLTAKSRYGAGKIVLEDGDRQTLTYGRLVLGSLVLGAALARLTRHRETVGVMLPNVAGLVVSLFGLNAFGRVSAMLNFTSGLRNLSSAISTGGIRTLITSRRFIEIAKLGDVMDGLASVEVAPGEQLRIVYLEDVRAEIRFASKAIGLLQSPFAAILHSRHELKPDDPAVILFTSGTEGVPKGVVLTNANLVSNAQQMFAHAAGVLQPDDAVMNPLPMFHSFGLTAGTLLPILNGLKAVLYPSPLQYRQVAKFIQQTRPTLLFATDTFLQGYARAAEPGELDSVRLVVAGAERVKDATRKLWSEYGTELLEGYGATECSPVIAFNLPAANRHGTVGRTLPGIETRLERVEGIAEGGRLLIRGPNVMAGYLLAGRPGVVEAPHGGWHDTGDIVTIEDGFITIRGRAKRFAKIGGEMVSLAAVESLPADLWPGAQHVVVSLPDERRGEQLVLVTDHAGADKAALLAHGRKQGFPELWVPKVILVVAAIPVLGSGKVDLPATAEMARNARPLL